MCQQIKVLFPVVSAGIDTGASFESMWADPVGGNIFTLDNVPISLQGISLGDEFEVEFREGQAYFSRVIKRSSNRTFRFDFRDIEFDKATKDWFLGEIETYTNGYGGNWKSWYYSYNIPESKYNKSFHEFLSDLSRRGVIIAESSGPETPLDCINTPHKITTEFSCRNVWERGQPVLSVWHHHDGDWSLLCGGDEQERDESELLVLHKEHLAQRDPTLFSILDLPTGWVAERETVGDSWIREPYEESEG